MIIDAHLHVDDIPALGWKLEAARVRAPDGRGGDRAGRDHDDRRRTRGEPRRARADRRGLRGPPRPAGGVRPDPPLVRRRRRSLCSSGRSRSASRGSSSTRCRRSPIRPGDDSLRLIRAAAAHGAPTLFHCGDEPLTHAAGDRPRGRGLPGGDDRARPHGWLLSTWTRRSRRPSATRTSCSRPRRCRTRRRSGEAVARIGAERVLYASDGPACSPLIEVEKVRLAGLDRDAERLVLGENAGRMLDAVA